MGLDILARLFMIRFSDSCLCLWVLFFHSKKAVRAMTAMKDNWNPTDAICLGSDNKMMKAVMATIRTLKIVRSSRTANNASVVIIHARSTEMLSPAKNRYMQAVNIATMAAIFFMGLRNAHGLCRLSNNLVRKNTDRAAHPICSPDMARRCANPLNLIFSWSCVVILPLNPVSRAVATSPLLPSIEFLILVAILFLHLKVLKWMKFLIFLNPSHSPWYGLVIVALANAKPL